MVETRFVDRATDGLDHGADIVAFDNSFALVSPASLWARG